MEVVREDAAAAEAAQRDAPMADAGGSADGVSAPQAGSAERQSEAVYVLLELDDLDAKGQLQPGHAIELSGLDTFRPTVKLPDGTTCAVEHDETIGSCILFGVSGGGAGHSSSAPAQPNLEYICTTERLLKVQSPPPHKPP